jgi:hypothetical protein
MGWTFKCKTVEAAIIPDIRLVTASGKEYNALN